MIRKSRMGSLRRVLGECSARLPTVRVMALRSGESSSLATTSDRKKQLVVAFSGVWAWVFLAGLIIFFAISVSIQSGGDVNFLTIRNSQNILMAIVPVLLMGLGQTFVVIAAGIDLSVGWVMGLASVVSALQ